MTPYALRHQHHRGIDSVAKDTDYGVTTICLCHMRQWLHLRAYPLSDKYTKHSLCAKNLCPLFEYSTRFMCKHLIGMMIASHSIHTHASKRWNFNDVLAPLSMLHTALRSATRVQRTASISDTFTTMTQLKSVRLHRLPVMGWPHSTTLYWRVC
jgi:hypothetical protein